MFWLTGKKAQSVIEYGILIAVMAAAFTTMKIYTQRSAQFRLKAMFDVLGSQDEPTAPRIEAISQSRQAETQLPAVTVLMQQGGAGAASFEKTVNSQSTAETRQNRHFY